MELFFSIVQRKVVTPNDFTSLDQVETRVRQMIVLLEASMPA